MTKAGLQFLQSLAAQRNSGCFLEIGPLFGSSTNAIDAGRADETVPIHTIDTFDPAPWIERRLGVNLSIDAFRKFTRGIRNLHIHQGFAPDIVRESWSESIGFYFDDATHGDPGWTDNFSFFRPFFTNDAIICGDDFAGGWPDIVRNVYELTETDDLTLFVIGRVWAFTWGDDTRLAAAVNTAFPRLRDARLNVRHGPKQHSNIAASWSWGLHRTEPLTELSLDAPNGFEFGLTVDRQDGTFDTKMLGREPVNLEGAKGVSLAMPAGFAAQFCVMDEHGHTENTKELHRLVLNEGSRITAFRLTHR